jgi:uncharacterized protein with GYD domain
MKYVLLGTLSPEWAAKQTERIGKASAKLEKLGIRVESIHYTQGQFDFVDLVDAPNAEAVLTFSVWYAAQGLGRVQSLPAFDPKTFEAAVKLAKTRAPMPRWAGHERGTPSANKNTWGSMGPAPRRLPRRRRAMPPARKSSSPT